MNNQLFRSIFVATFLIVAGWAGSVSAKTDFSEQAAAQVAAQYGATLESNPLLQPYAGPFGGVPAFDRMKLEDVKPALEAGMALNLAEIDLIAANPEEPNFENTILAMERSGQALERARTYYSLMSGNLSTPEFREVQTEMAPRLAEFSSKITQNQGLFQRIKAIYEGDEYKTLDPDQQRLVWLIYTGFANNGATLEGKAKERYAAINQELAGLYTQFSNNVLSDEESYVTYLNTDQLAGLPQSFVDAAAAAAEDLGHPGEYAVTNTRSSMDPFLTYSDERGLREQVWRSYYSRGNNGDEHDNNAIVWRILKLRDERVGLLGFDNYAQWRLQDRMAKTPDNAFGLVQAIWPAAVARVHEEVADMQAIADAEGSGITIAPWDYRYYAEKVRKAKYDLDSDEIKQYLQLDRLREAMFMVAGEIFNFRFTPVADGSVPVFHPDVRVWEVTDRDSGEHIGVWYLDPYARPGKRSGAWATTYQDRESFDGLKTVVGSNNSNFVKGKVGEPALVSWDDAETLFHEFGHALHYFSSKVRYPTLNSGVRDFTEFQSQLLERWLPTDRVISKYLVHYRTGKPMPAELVQKIKAASTFNQGFATTEYLASALMDMVYHTIEPEGIIEVQAFEAVKLKELGMPDELPMRHRTTQFNHIFSGEGYSAGYYGYIWADVLTSDAAEAFAAAPGGFYDKGVAERLVKDLFAPRNSIDPAEAYRQFRGRDANIDALMRDRGFPVPAAGDAGE